jgi:hypothetical protein
MEGVFFFLPRQFKSVLAVREVFLYKSQPNSFEQQINKSKSIEKKLMKRNFGVVDWKNKYSKRALQFS